MLENPVYWVSTSWLFCTVLVACPAFRLNPPDWTDWGIETCFWGLPDLNPLLVSLSLQYYRLLATQSVKLLPNALWTSSIQDSVFKTVHLNPPGNRCVAIARKLLGVWRNRAQECNLGTVWWFRMLFNFRSDHFFQLKNCDQKWWFNWSRLNDSSTLSCCFDNFLLKEI